MIGSSESRLQLILHCNGTPSTRASRLWQWWKCVMLGYILYLGDQTMEQTTGPWLTSREHQQDQALNRVLGPQPNLESSSGDARNLLLGSVPRGTIKSTCLFPGTCNYLHVCASCHQHHKARDWTQTPEDLEYKRRLPDTHPQKTRDEYR